jgi:branched-chain amino acid transport system ATP-binding protein
MSVSYILTAENLTKEFKGFVAVDDVTLKVRQGQIHALIGPNGAGKTTCFNLLTKFLPPTRGTISYKDKNITGLSPADIARQGMVRSFQISAVFPHLTVLENVRIALQRKRGDSFDFWRSEKVLSQYDEPARALLVDVGLTEFESVLASDLPYGRKRALELATTLALDPELLLLDEPMAGMGHEDVDRIATLIKRISANRTILMVEHNLSVVASLVGHDHGARPRQGAGRRRLRDRVARSARHRSLYRSGSWLRRHWRTRQSAAHTQACSKCATCRAGMARAMCLHGVNFDVKPGEVVTLLGRNGAGKTTTLKAVMGILGKRSGSVTFDGRQTISLPARAIARAGIAFCPGGARHLLVALGGGEPDAAAAGARRRHERRTDISTFPQSEGTPVEPGHQTVWRRAADAGDRPHPAHRRKDAAA